ncbi:MULTISPECIES: Hsp20/alpha crystallin family protein [Salinibaculum]|uniref:Hsp20/alpha crystallin family protein n=1 Tax=Salinibaculum TaxID=2732368 RepID=UPI0030D00D69
MAFRNDPFEQMNRLFEQMRWSMLDETPAFGSTSRPRTEDWRTDTNLSVEPTDDGYVVMADLPGFEKDDLTISFEDGSLTVRGESDVSEETSHGTRRHSRHVHERVHIDGDVVTDDITATYHNGVLEVVVPTEEEPADDTHVIDIE